MLRIGIIGCGRIADQHAIEISRLQNCMIVGVCDREPILAKQLCERFDVQEAFTDVDIFLEKVKPDIVHITTPPQSHFELGKLCLEKGCNVFMEKPFTVNTQEAEGLIQIANNENLKITVGHNVQFSHTAIQTRELIKSGHLGGEPFHMDSTWCYSFGNPGYAKAILGDSNHWIRALPGRYLHDIIPHGIAKIVEFLKSENPTVIAHGYVSPLLKSIGEFDIIDELRVIINDNDNCTAYFTFSSQMTPPVKQFRIYGPDGFVISDHNHQTVIRGTKQYTYYLNHFFPPFIDAKQYVANSMRNITKFIKKDFHFESGRHSLIDLFYQSVSHDAPLPISYREILLTTKIMDTIFEQIYSQ